MLSVVFACVSSTRVPSFSAQRPAATVPAKRRACRSRRPARATARTPPPAELAHAEEQADDLARRRLVLHVSPEPDSISGATPKCRLICWVTTRGAARPGSVARDPRAEHAQHRVRRVVVRRLVDQGGELRHGGRARDREDPRLAGVACGRRFPVTSMPRCCSAPMGTARGEAGRPALGVGAVASAARDPTRSACGGRSVAGARSGRRRRTGSAGRTAGRGRARAGTATRRRR